MKILKKSQTKEKATPSLINKQLKPVSVQSTLYVEVFNIVIPTCGSGSLDL